MIEEYECDWRNRIESICVYKDAISLFEQHYEYDHVGNILSITSGFQATDTFGYDVRNRLVSASVNNIDIGYNLDAMGNRISVVTDGVAVDYVTEDRNLLTQVGDTSLSYDNCGNLISKGSYTYTYDPENRLTMVKENGIPVAEYWYDGLGNRVRSLENWEDIYYIYNGLNIIQEHNAIDNSRTDYIFAGIRRIAEKTGGVVRYYHADHLGSTRLITDSQGSIVAEYKYYPYGANLAQNIQDPGFDGATYRFTGKGDSPNTGLYYFSARFYDPEMGRFITLDPARDGLNWYEYCGSNPLVYVDLWGLNTCGPGDNPIWEDNPNENSIVTFLKNLFRGFVRLFASEPTGKAVSSTRTIYCAEVDVPFGKVNDYAQFNITDVEERLALPIPKEENPWKEGTQIYAGELTEPVVMYRVYGGRVSLSGAWLTSVRPSSRQNAIQLLALPLENTAELYAEVVVPAGTRVQVGIAGPNWGRPGGAV